MPAQKYTCCVSLGLFLLLVLLGACSSAKTSTPATVLTATYAPSQTPTVLATEAAPTLTPTATPPAAGDIGWRQVRGVVYEGEATPGRELAGVRVECSQFSYFPREGSCAPYQITTGSDGAFTFDVFVHDTDGIRLSAEKPGYEPAEDKIGGFDCVGACPFISLVLTPTVSLTHHLGLVGHRGGSADAMVVQGSRPTKTLEVDRPDRAKPPGPIPPRPLLPGRTESTMRVAIGHR